MYFQVILMQSIVTRALIIHEVYFSTNVLPSNTAGMYNREGTCNSLYVGGCLCSGDKQFVVQEVTIYCMMEMRIPEGFLYLDQVLSCTICITHKDALEINHDVIGTATPHWTSARNSNFKFPVSVLIIGITKHLNNTIFHPEEIRVQYLYKGKKIYEYYWS